MSRDTVLLRHRKEKKSKCSLQPLVGKPGFTFVSWPAGTLPDLTGYLRLDPEGPPLRAEDRDQGLLLVDATWRYAERMIASVAEVPGRSLPGLQTAYPRRSKLHEEPEGGLASIEALYAAYLITGRATEGLLDGYRWAEAFVAANADAFESYRRAATIP